MIRIIEPSSHERYQSEIDILLAIFKKILPSDFKLSPEEKAASTYMVAKDSIYGVYGGAILRKKPFCDFDDQIETLLSILHSSKRKAWAAQFCTYLPENPRLSYQDRIFLFREFYLKLYRKFMIFGKKQKTNFLVVSIAQPDYSISDCFYDWPYIVKVLPDTGYDPFFHGILDVRRERYRSSDSEIWPLRYLPNRKVRKHIPPVVSAAKNDTLLDSSPNEIVPSSHQESLVHEVQKQDFGPSHQNHPDRPVQ